MNERNRWISKKDDPRLEITRMDVLRTHLISAADRKRLLRDAASVIECIGHLAMAEESYRAWLRENAASVPLAVQSAIFELRGAIAHARGSLSGTVDEMERILLSLSGPDLRGDYVDAATEGGRMLIELERERRSESDE